MNYCPCGQPATEQQSLFCQECVADSNKVLKHMRHAFQRGAFKWAAAYANDLDELLSNQGALPTDWC